MRTLIAILVLGLMPQYIVAQNLIELPRRIIPFQAPFGSPSSAVNTLRTNNLSLSATTVAPQATYYYSQRVPIDLGAVPIGSFLPITIDFYSDPLAITQPMGSVLLSGSSDFYIQSNGCAGAIFLMVSIVISI